jgi:hypothetical protein
MAVRNAIRPSYFDVRDQVDRELQRAYPWDPETPDPGETSYFALAHAVIRHAYYKPGHDNDLRLNPYYCSLSGLSELTRIPRDTVTHLLAGLESRDRLFTVNWGDDEIEAVSVRPVFNRTPSRRY